MKNVVRINCRTKQIDIQPEGREFQLMGGRRLTSHIISTEVDPKTDPLGPGNKLVFAGMLLTGTTISTANRMSVGTKSPLTGGIKEANVGGMAGFFMSAHGIKALVLEDAPEAPELNVLVFRADGSIAFEDGSFLKNKGTYDTSVLLREKYGEKICVTAIGPAGERGYLNSSIQVSEMSIDHPTRAAARGGVGAVMGSKGIKAIVMERAANPWKWPYVDEAMYKEHSKAVIQNVMANKGGNGEHGTAYILGHTLPTGIGPYRNFSGGVMTEEELAKYNVDVVLNRIRSYGGGTGHACQPGCVVKCSNIFNDEKGEFITAGLEYEILELAGPNCAILDTETVARIDRFCDDFGFDNIELSVTLGVYMDSGKLEFGDEEGTLKLFETFWEGGEVADDFGSGAERLGKKYGVKHIPTVKGQAMAAYEPRTLKGTGTTYMISPMGADHTCGASLSRKDLVGTSKEGQLEFSVGANSAMAAADSNVCLFAWGGTLGVKDDYLACIKGALGVDWTFADLMGLGAQAVKAERDFNTRAGFTPEDDRLPEYMYNEPSFNGAVFDITDEEVLEQWHGIKKK